jgi:hypothetical protein
VDVIVAKAVVGGQVPETVIERLRLQHGAAGKKSDGGCQKILYGS